MKTGFSYLPEISSINAKVVAKAKYGTLQRKKL